MNKGGIGIGSASIVLVFAVLCLSVFSLIAFVVAGNEKALVDSEAELVVKYYETDKLAEQIAADIQNADIIPETIRDIEIKTQWDHEMEADVVYYLCPISEKKSLYVRLAVYIDSYDIMAWRMVDTDEWEYDDSLNVWQGDEMLEFPDMFNPGMLG